MDLSEGGWLEHVDLGGRGSAHFGDDVLIRSFLTLEQAGLLLNLPQRHTSCSAAAVEGIIPGIPGIPFI